MKALALSLNHMSALYMCGVIWLVQLIHYPSFSKINSGSFQQFHSQHTTAMSFIVGPVMVIELLTSVWLLHDETNLSNLTNVIFVISLWLLTFLVSVPLHNKLALGHDPAVLQSLVQTNWPRTVLWTLRAVWSSYLTLTSFKI